MTSKRINNITNRLIFLQDNNRIKEAADLYSNTVKELKKDTILGSDLEWINNLIYPETYMRLNDISFF